MEKEESTEDSTLAALAACPKRYEIKRLLGRGGMGLVFLALDQQLNRDVAIKILWTDGHCDDTTRARFMREARALSVLDHPNIVKIFTSGLNEKGYPYHIMEFLEGESLAAELSRGKITEERFYEIFSQVVAGLAHAHEKGIAHRDLKPSNIMSCTGSDSQDRVCKIIDFGIARFEFNAEQTAHTITRTEAFLGSPLYMSPEQCRAERGDFRSDIYMLGCIMYECITGSPPFVGESGMDTMYKHMAELAPNLQKQTLSPISNRLAALIFACLQKDPAARPGSMSVISEELKEIFSSKSQNIDLFKQAAKHRKERNWTAIATLLFLSVAGAVLFTILSLRKEENPGSVIHTLQEKVDDKIADSKLKLKNRSDAAFPEKIKLLFDLGRWQLKSTSIQDLAAAESTYSQALSLCESNSASAGRRAACLVLRGKAKWKQEKASEAQADFDSALKLIQSIEDPEQHELMYDYYEELILMHIHQRRFSEVLKELPASASCWENYHKAKGLEMLQYANPHLDEKGDERRQLYRNCAEELQNLAPRNETEAIQMMRIALSYYQVLSERLYRHPPSAAHKMQTFAEALLKKIKASPSKTELKQKFESLQETFRQQNKETRVDFLKQSQ